jgi:two-component system chemotaxis response regulator CheY
MDSGQRGIRVNKTVLVVEDSVEMRSYVSDALRVAGYRVIEAEDGVVALRRIEAARELHMVVTDLNMPNLDGYGLIASVRASERHAGIPILALSHHDDDVSKLSARAAGASDSITKPFVRRHLLETVAGMLA